ncbi:MAG TPA: hypothetical protein VNE41_11255 [Chitinophagaceae bacterium]|nr:hypothetical protein [Chitinophagaceae bacterium]
MTTFPVNIARSDKYYKDQSWLGIQESTAAQYKPHAFNSLLILKTIYYTGLYYEYQKKNYISAISWYTKAPISDNPNVSGNILDFLQEGWFKAGMWYDEGKKGPRDLTQALVCYQNVNYPPYPKRPIDFNFYDEQKIRLGMDQDTVNESLEHN